MADITWNDDAVADALLGPGGAAHKELQRKQIKVERRSKRLCPVDTGRLRSSIARGEITRTGDTIEGRIGTDVEYAKHVEYGTTVSRAQPYLRPALDAVK